VLYTITGLIATLRELDIDEQRLQVKLSRQVARNPADGLLHRRSGCPFVSSRELTPVTVMLADLEHGLCFQCDAALPAQLEDLEGYLSLLDVLTFASQQFNLTDPAQARRWLRESSRCFDELRSVRKLGALDPTVVEEVHRRLNSRYLQVKQAVRTPQARQRILRRLQEWQEICFPRSDVWIFDETDLGPDVVFGLSGYNAYRGSDVLFDQNRGFFVMVAPAAVHRWMYAIAHEDEETPSGWSPEYVDVSPAVPATPGLAEVIAGIWRPHDDGELAKFSSAAAAAAQLN
jgi:hypothetical protein